ncbi:MAG: hypothetical protein V1722_00055 [Candidatus Micrarchaeota archaeon]
MHRRIGTALTKLGVTFTADAKSGALTIPLHAGNSHIFEHHQDALGFSAGQPIHEQLGEWARFICRSRMSDHAVRAGLSEYTSKAPRNITLEVHRKR